MSSPKSLRTVSSILAARGGCALHSAPRLLESKALRQQLFWNFLKIVFSVFRQFFLLTHLSLKGEFNI